MRACVRPTHQWEQGVGAVASSEPLSEEQEWQIIQQNEGQGQGQGQGHSGSFLIRNDAVSHTLRTYIHDYVVQGRGSARNSLIVPSKGTYAGLPYPPKQ